ncbi:MAG: hypothetical protein NXY57DRAFT_896856 [Lentinula lateritia]|nr:MAG: hypothetical protein NXY57DRAFT_896856 [Lentinula lateritia]
MCEYSKEELPESKKQIKTYLQFQLGHPQYTTHCLKKMDAGNYQQVPVLKGYPIPRSDKIECQDKYMIAMLALFKPWSHNEQSPLKAPQEAWNTAFNTWKDTDLFKSHIKIINNMQLLYESKDAKLDYSAQRQKDWQSFPTN